ncbi:MAG: hypothetical protein GY775_16620 [Candidatus Scalindua sp.]|nr:hypothetical protein [Candidatus Scalindua sp.]
MSNYTIAAFEDFEMLHKFMYPNDPLKSWINKENYINTFNVDWNSLMKVVDKIESIVDESKISKFNIIIEQFFCEIIDTSNSDILVSVDADTKIEAVFTACVKFVKLHIN